MIELRLSTLRTRLIHPTPIISFQRFDLKQLILSEFQFILLQPSIIV